MVNEPARNPPAPLSPDEELAWRALARAVLVIPKVLDGELLQAQGLGLTEYSVLMNLSEQPGRSMRMSELANAVMISASGLTRVVERLTRQGLAERVKAGTDGRGQLAVLTPRDSPGWRRPTRPSWPPCASTSWTTWQTSTPPPSPTPCRASPHPRWARQCGAPPTSPA